MKKLLFLLTAIIFLNSCDDAKKSNDTDTTKSTTTESLFTGKFEMLGSHPAKIDGPKLRKLKENARRQHPNNREGIIVDYGNDLEKLIYELVGEENVSLERIRYDETDEDAYCKAHNLQRNDDPAKNPCKVAHYTNLVLKVLINKADVDAKIAPPEYLYYDAYKVCPPPYDGTCSVAPDPGADGDSSNAKKSN